MSIIVLGVLFFCLKINKSNSKKKKMKKMMMMLICVTLILKTQIITAQQQQQQVEVTYHDDVSPNFQLDLLHSKISQLESDVEEKVRELRTKDESINQLENIIQEKSDAISSLQNDIESVRGKGNVNSKEQVGKAQARINELETQVANLRKETEKLSQKRNSLESRARTAEKKVSELNLKLENLKRVSDEQTTKIQKTERALQVAEEEMMKAKSRETKIFKELKEVQQSWVPHWLSIHLLHCQSFISTHWKESGKPMMDSTLQKALQKKAKVCKWAEPHIETVKTKWVPVVKDQSTRLVTQIQPGVKLLTTKTTRVYHESKKSIEPHLEKLLEIVDPYFQEMKKFTKPYIDQAVTSAKPHFDNVSVLLKPYTKKITRAYRKLLKAVKRYHLQLQKAIRDILMNNELTKPYATEKLVWFSASAFMAIPVIFLFKLMSPVRRRPKRRTRTSHTGHSRRKASKRSHAEN